MSGFWSAIVLFLKELFVALVVKEKPDGIHVLGSERVKDELRRHVIDSLDPENNSKSSADTELL
jgi:hypothetical protein